MAEGNESKVYIPFEERAGYREFEGGNQLSDLDLGGDSQPDAPDAILSRNLWRSKRRFKRGKDKIRLANSKDVSQYLQHCTGDINKAFLSVITELDLTKFPEGRITLFLTEFLQRGANIATSDKNGDTALHLAAHRGFTEVAKELLRWGADPHRKGRNGEIPMEIAINLALSANEENAKDYNNFAVTMIQEMEPARVRQMFLVEDGQSAKLNFHHLLHNVDMQETVQAVLDTLIERVPGRKRTYIVYYGLLEASESGRVVKGHSKPSLRRQLGKSVFDEIAWTSNKDVVVHLAVRLLMLSKWRRFARTSLILHFIVWAVVMASISVALIVAAMEQHPELYDEPVDIFRGVCEGITLLLVTLSFLTELYHIYLWRLQYFKDYSFFIYNYLNIAAMTFLVVLIPLRIIDLDEQWIFASFAYLCYSIRVFRFVQAVPVLGNYVEILKHILVRDMIPFVSIFVILLFIFCGGFYFALREEVLPPVSAVSCNVSSISGALQTLNVSVADLESAINITNSTVPGPFRTSLDINPEETSTYERIFFTGIRLGVEGQNFLTYFGPQGFGWLGVTTYLIFLFFIEVVLLNLLIAQMSDTFSTVQGDAQRSLAITKARTIISIERTGLSVLKYITDFYLAYEEWTNPEKHVDRLDKTSLTNIHKTTRKMQRVVNQHSEVLEELRETLAEQKLSMNEKFDKILARLSENVHESDNDI